MRQFGAPSRLSIVPTMFLLLLLQLLLIFFRINKEWWMRRLLSKRSSASSGRSSTVRPMLRWLELKAGVMSRTGSMNRPTLWTSTLPYCATASQRSRPPQDSPAVNPMALSQVNRDGAMFICRPSLCVQLPLLCQIAHYPLSCNLSSESVLALYRGRYKFVRVLLR